MEAFVNSICGLIRVRGSTFVCVSRTRIGVSVLSRQYTEKCNKEVFLRVPSSYIPCVVNHPTYLPAQGLPTCLPLSHIPLVNCLVGRFRNASDTLSFPGLPFRRSLVEVKFRKNNKDTSKIPFKVLRTPSGNLPVYSRIRKHGTVVTTVVRHALGDITALKKDLLAVCEAPVRERCGTVEIKGLHVLKIKQWLTHLGF